MLVAGTLRDQPLRELSQASSTALMVSWSSNLAKWQLMLLNCWCKILVACC